MVAKKCMINQFIKLKLTNPSVTFTVITVSISIWNDGSFNFWWWAVVVIKQTLKGVKRMSGTRLRYGLPRLHSSRWWNSWFLSVLKNQENINIYYSFVHNTISRFSLFPICPFVGGDRRTAKTLEN